MEYGGIFNIPTGDGTFDILTCISVVEHIPEKYFAFKEMLRVLKPGGILIVTYELVDSGSRNFVENDTRVEIFSPELIQETLSAFDIETIISHTSHDVQKSIDDIQVDNVNIHSGITVGGFVLEKENKLK
jgi:2-polyprenyl-3-methyl-5-hydroxy-6-metoxy-1,4-benzoquinol methylase